MAGNKAGGLKAAARNKRKYGDDFYKRIGAQGGRNGNTGGFAANPQLARIAGMRGGLQRKNSPPSKQMSDEDILTRLREIDAGR